MAFDQPRRTSLGYGFALTCGIAVAIVARIIWRCRLASEIIQAVTSRGELPKYRHHIRWRR